MTKEECKKCPNYLLFHRAEFCAAHRARLTLRKAIETCRGPQTNDEPCRRCSMSEYRKTADGRTELYCNAIKLTLDYNEQAGTCGHYRTYTQEEVFV